MQCRACTSIAERQGKCEAKMLPLLLNRIDCHITLCKLDIEDVEFEEADLELDVLFPDIKAQQSSDTIESH